MRIRNIAPLGVLLVGLTALACQPADEGGTMDETAGEVMDDAGDAMDEAADEAGEMADTAMDEAGEMADTAAAEMEDAANEAEDAMTEE